MDDLEEGEVIDSENEEEKATLVNAECQPNSFSWRVKSSCAGLSSASLAMMTGGGLGQQPIQRLRSDSCDSASSFEASDSDSDGAPLAKKKCSNSQSAVPSSAATRPSTKRNMIWGSVLQEQTLAKDLSGWSGMNKKVKSDRDVETYDYVSAKNFSAVDNGIGTDGIDVDVADDVTELSPKHDEVDICDRETFGTMSNGSGNAKSRKRKRNGNSAGFKHKHQTDQNKGRESARNRLNTRTYNHEKDRSHIRVGVNDPATAVGEELMRVLGEPPHMKDIFSRVAEALGGEKALELLYCTEDLEEAGGLMILNGSRRRTPGGVYLFLVKEDASITREQEDIIFYGSVKERRRQEREKKRLRWQHHRDRITTTKSYPPNTALRPLPDCHDLFLLDKLPHDRAGSRSPAVNDENSDMCDDAAEAEDKLDDDDDALQIELV